MCVGGGEGGKVSDPGEALHLGRQASSVVFRVLRTGPAQARGDYVVHQPHYCNGDKRRGTVRGRLEDQACGWRLPRRKALRACVSRGGTEQTPR